MTNKVVTRFPPSPTGLIHLGNVRTLLFNYLYAKKHNGKIVFRSEDTDRARSKREFEDTNLKDLAWLELSWDEFYRQSERADIYRGHLERLVSEGKAYLSKEESKAKPGEMVEVVRLRNQNKIIKFDDVVRGEISFDTTELGDVVIARSLDDALYHFAVVVDDFEMGITHVIRGEDHISNTPRQILIQEAIGASRPIYAHVPLILAPDRTKLSKRHGAVSLGEYREQGFLPATLANYLALLGWSPGTDEEVFSMEELIERFALEGIQKGGAIFDQQKLLWFNKQHLNKLSDDDYSAMIEKSLPERVKKLPEYSTEKLARLMPTIRERISLTKEFTSEAENGEYDFAFAAPEVSIEMLKWKKDNSAGDALPRLQKCQELLNAADFSTPDSIKAALWDYAEKEGRGEVLWPLRVALTGMEKSPDPFTVAYVIGQEYTLKRLQNAVLKLEGAK